MALVAQYGSTVETSTDWRIRVMNRFYELWGVLIYEFRMQIRRPAVWITFFLLGLLLTGISGGQIFTSLLTNSDHLPLLQELAEWTITMNALMPIGVGVLLADRLPRDSRSRVDELFNALPGTLS